MSLENDALTPEETRPIEEVLREYKLRHLFAEEPQWTATVETGSALRDALEILRQDRSRGAVLVVRTQGEGDQRVVGIFTERDYLDKCAGVATDLTRPIDESMTRDPQSVSPDDSMHTAIRLMTQGGYRHLPVSDGGRLVGLVSTQDIIGYLAEFFPMEVYNLPPRLHQNNNIDTREGG